MSEKEVNLKKSLEKFGQIYPIVKTQFGIADGKHREKEGCKDVKTVKVPTEIDHWVIRYQLNTPDKTLEEQMAEKRICAEKIAELIKKQNPTIKQRELQRKVAEKLGVSDRTVRNYLGKPFPKSKKGKLHEERKKDYLAIIRNHKPESTGLEPSVERKIIREIFRDVKPFYRTKDELEHFGWKAWRKSREDFIRFFIKEKYFYTGPYRGWRPELPYWLKLKFEALANENETAESLVCDVLSKYDRGKHLKEAIEILKAHLVDDSIIGILEKHIPKEEITEEALIRMAREELKREAGV